MIFAYFAGAFVVALAAWLFGSIMRNCSSPTATSPPGSPCRQAPCRRLWPPRRDTVEEEKRRLP